MRTGSEVEAREVKCLCPMCASRCGITLETRADVIVGVKPNPEHVLRRLCVKSQAVPEMHISKDRLFYPLKRSNGGAWQRITWDEALDFIASKLTEIKEKYGPESLVLGIGHGLFNRQSVGLRHRFAEAYGTPNLIDAGCLCRFPTSAANYITFGDDGDSDPARSKCVLIWGLNPYHSQEPARAIYEELPKKGVKTIVVDPRRIREAKTADIFLPIRPGTDWALMLAFINTIISENLYEKEFIDQWTVGFDRLSEAVKGYSLEWAEKVTGVPVDKAREAVRMYATTKPATIATFATLEHTSHSFQSLRCYSILSAITGNVGKPGGLRLMVPPPKLLRWPYQDPAYTMAEKKKSFTAGKYPIWDNLSKEPCGNEFAETVISGKPYPVKAAIFQAFNPAVTYVNTNKVKEALRKLELLVVMDIWMSETAECATIVLPACDGLEHTWCHSYVWAHLPLVALSKKVFEPAGERRPDSMFWVDLAKRLGFERDFPWNSPEEIIDWIARSFGKTIKDLEENSRGLFYAPKEAEYFFVEKGFRTPSGKIELYSKRLEEWGIAPLPVPYEEPLVSPVSTPELFKEYPLMCISGTRSTHWEHSQGRLLPYLRSREPDPEVEINPQDSEKNGINHGEWVIIESRKGKVKMKANVTEDIMPGVISIPHGWGGEANCNLLTDDEVLDPVLGAVICRGLPVRARQAD